MPQLLSEPRRPRADAQRNRDRLLAAAHAVFAEHGVSASVHEIVQRAGVGVGTLYRHFPTREALVAAIFDEHIDGARAATRFHAGRPRRTPLVARNRARCDRAGGGR